MLRIVKPKNARSKRAMEAREPKEVEDAKTVIFVRGTHTGEVLNSVIKDLFALKKPNAVSFSKKNAIRPFEDASSIEFWSKKNDASLFVVAQTTKKRPNSLCFARTFDGRLLDMCEVGVDSWKPMSDFKTPKSTPGHKPLLHFASELFDSHPRFIQLKSILLDFFNGEEMEGICLTGIQHIISVSLGPTPSTLTSVDAESESPLPPVHIRTYTLKLLSSGSRVPRVELVPMGPSLDVSLRRHQDPDPTLWKEAMRRPKLKKTDVEKGLGKKRKNMEVDEMGDLRGKVHIAKQNLDKLQTRKMKGLKDPGERTEKRRRVDSPS